ncbi:MAG: 2,3-bisphosphoglycerate-independent phosphoglycerate mutase [Thermaceae bacterium]
MDLFSVYKELHQKGGRILLVVLDGVGGLPLEAGGPTELEAARTPNLDRLAEESALGLLTPVYPGLTPGSGPGHLALFGYDPFRFQVGRGALSALGLGADFREGDVALRGNFAIFSPEGLVLDRRAGRPSTEENQRVIARLKEAVPRIGDVEVHFYTESEHRFLVILRGAGLSPRISDTDPQATGLPPRAAQALEKEAEKTAEIVNTLSQRIREVLLDEPRLNGALFRGASGRPKFPSMQEVYGLRAAAVASYPMYKGLASLVGMEILPVEGEGDAHEGKLRALREHWDRFDLFYLHFKGTDAKGEDGDFWGKAKEIELFDAWLPHLLALEPDVFALTGDHSTPALLKAHSWHPVPLLLKAPFLRPDESKRFTEREALRGSLGHLRGVELMPLLLAHAGRLGKYGA